MTTTTIEKVTVKQASQAINQLATNFMESNEIDADLLSIVTTGITTNTTAHLRDYMLGMPNDFGVQFMIRFAEAIAEKTETHNS
jgi:chorismate mutase